MLLWGEGGISKKKIVSQPPQNKHRPAQKKNIMNMYKAIWNFKALKDNIWKHVHVAAKPKEGFELKSCSL